MIFFYFFYQGGPYEAFAGHDASRGLACMSMSAKEGPDDLRDLTPLQQQSLDSWQKQFDGKPNNQLFSSVFVNQGPSRHKKHHFY
jgi:hypothetical protein